MVKRLGKQRQHLLNTLEGTLQRFCTTRRRLRLPGTVKLHSTFGFFAENRSALSEGSKDFMLTGSNQRLSIDGTAPATAVYCGIIFRLSEGNGQKAAGALFLNDARLIGAGVEPPPPLVPRVVPVTLPSDDVPLASLVLMR